MSQSPYLQPGTTDSDPYFDLPNGRLGRLRIPPPPKTTMVYCPLCGRHWEALARDNYRNARVELCPEHSKLNDEEEWDKELERLYGRPDDVPWPSDDEMRHDAENYE